MKRLTVALAVFVFFVIGAEMTVKRGVYKLPSHELPQVQRDVAELQAAVKPRKRRPPVVATPIPPSIPIPPTSFPASFYTGPLGANNVVPATSDGALFGIWVGISGNSAEAQWNYLVDHVADIGRTPDLIGAQQETYTWGGITTEDRINSLGAVPVIALGEGGVGDMYDGYTPQEIVDGVADTSLNTLADRYGAEGYRIMVAPAREFELTLDGQGGTIIDTPAKQATFRAAWVRMVQRFQARGADNVGWYWSPGEQMDGGGTRGYQDACYPGDAYVDWVGSTGYNQDRAHVWTTPLHAGWAEFQEIFGYQALGAAGPSFLEARGDEKPFIVAETGSLFSNTGNATRKRDWLKNIDDVAKPNLPGLRGVIYFGQAMAPDECRVDWRAYSDANAQDNFDHPSGCASGVHGAFDQTSWDGFLYWAGRPRWNVGVF